MQDRLPDHAQACGLSAMFDGFLCIHCSALKKTDRPRPRGYPNGRASLGDFPLQKRDPL